MDWWAKLIHEDARAVDELAMPHMAKLHLAVARHLAKDHGHRFTRQVEVRRITTLHFKAHGIKPSLRDNPWTSLRHPHPGPALSDTTRRRF